LGQLIRAKPSRKQISSPSAQNQHHQHRLQHKISAAAAQQYHQLHQKRPAKYIVLQFQPSGTRYFCLKKAVRCYFERVARFAEGKINPALANV
jgi:hypothetical protein